MDTNKTPQYFLEIIQNNSSVVEKYRAIFELRAFDNQQAIECSKIAFQSLKNQQPKSCLLMHEVAYALGQKDQQYANQIVDFLIEIINDVDEFDIVRHEAAEALANIDQKRAIEIFTQYSYQETKNDPQFILRDTCQLALMKLKTYDELKHLYGLKYFGTIEPAAPFEQLDCDPFDYILSNNTNIFDKYRALYYIRNNYQKYFNRIDELLFSNLGALIKHEICFIIGQVSEAPENIVESIKKFCLDQNIPPIARHEALAAFQTINPKNTVEFLKQFIDDQDQIIRETAQVSLSQAEIYY